MRLIRRLLVLTIVVGGGVAGYAYWSGNVPRGATKVVSKTAEKAGEAAESVEGSIKESALTAKIKSKMALDDHVNARAINVDTAGSVATLTGVVASKDERRRAVQLARDTEGITRVVDKLEVRSQK